MAKSNTVATEKNSASTEPVIEPRETALPPIPEGFVDLGLDRFLYKPESCKAKPLQGYLIGVQEFGRDSADKDDWWDALIFSTTEPTLGVTKDDKGAETTMDVPAGEEVMIPVTEKLSKLVAYAKHPDLMAEFIVIPRDKIVLEMNKDGTVKKSMWRYKVVGRPPVPRVAKTGWDTMALPAATPASNGASLSQG